MSLKEQLEELEIGGSFTTDKSRAAVYVTASRALVKVTTKELANGKIEVTRIVPGEDNGATNGSSKVWKPETGISVAVKALRDLRAADRLLVFAEFELCCGMNRGDCVCEPENEVFVPAEESAEAHKQAKIAGLKGLLGSSAKTGAVDGVKYAFPTAPTRESIEESTFAWIEDDIAHENGEILYWHHHPKRKPVCYKRESDPNGA